MKDELWIGTALDGEARWAAVRTTALVEEATHRHQTSPVASAALGRLMTGALLLASSIKDEQAYITLRLLGDGPLGGVIAIANSHGEVRGYVHEPHIDIPLKGPGKLDVATAVGRGELIVNRSLANGESYTGTVPIVSGEIAEDLVHYLLHSEQVPSAMLLGVLVETDYHVAGAGGFLIQPLPGASEETIQMIEKQLELLKTGISPIMARSPEMPEIMEQLMGEISYRILEKREVHFSCTCSKTRFSRTLRHLGKKEIAGLIQEGKAEIVCHFCNEHYHFSQEELQKLWEQAEDTP